MTTESVKYKYSSDWIKKLESSNHWMHYWNQANLVLKHASPTDTILEIGVGSGFLANYLRFWGYNITTIDIDQDKKPDIVANIVEYEFKQEYDFILAFEVFEHIPYEEFEKILSKLKTICKQAVILSVPRNLKTWFEITIQTILSPRIFPFRLTTVRNKLTTDHHFWEIHYKDYRKSRFERSFESNGFKKIHVNTYRSTLFYVFQNLNER